MSEPLVTESRVSTRSVLSRVTPDRRIGESDHIVQFYVDDAALTDAVAEYLAPAFAVHEPIVMIATRGHQEKFVSALRDRGLDISAALANNTLLMLDADETLSRVMVDGMPDPARFEATVGTALVAALSAGQRRRVRAYGEMVDILWRAGNVQAAIRLEALWNEVAQKHPFSLLCAYSLGGLAAEEDLRSVCDAHGHVLSAVPERSYRFAGEPSLPPNHARALIAEIEHRKRIETDLRASLDEVREARLELSDFVENAPMPMHWVDRDGMIVWANAAELAFMGYPRDEYVNRPIADFHADPDVIGEMLSRLRRNETLQDFEARVRTKQGEIRHVLVYSNVYTKDGEFVHTRCFTRDVSHRRRIEDELRQRAAEARAAKLEAEDAVRVKDEFLAMLGHELRNPLSPIVTALQLMDMKLGETVRKERDAIQRQVTFLTRLVDDLLDIARITRGTVELRRAPVRIEDVLAQAVELAAPLIEQKQHNLQLAVDQATLWVDGDAHRLAQIVSNLLTNAARYTDHGGVITVGAAAKGSEVVIWVRDSGVGMTADLLPTVFDLFVHGGRRSAASGGLGLGLAIVKNLVGLHGGTVTAHSDGVGKGSEFLVRLPALDTQVARMPVSTLPVGATAANRRVLIVDDNVEAVRLLAEILDKAGFSVRCAVDGAAALAVARSFMPDACLLDIELPVLNGFDVAEALREVPGLADLKVIAVTGYARADDHERARESGFEAYLVKPIHPAHLTALLANGTR